MCLLECIASLISNEISRLTLRRGGVKKAYISNVSDGNGNARGNFDGRIEGRTCIVSLIKWHRPLGGRIGSSTYSCHFCQNLAI